MRLLLLISFLALSCAGCTAPAKKYSAPDATRVAASTRRFSESVAKSSAIAARAKSHVEAAQKAAGAEAAESATIINLVDELAGLVPPELKGKVEELKQSVDRQQAAAGDLATHLSGAQADHEQLAKQNAESTAAEIALKSDQAKYQAGAAAIAAAATNESARRYRAESQLIQQKIWRLAWRIGGGLIVLVVIVLFIAGKISIAGIRAWLHL